MSSPHHLALARKWRPQRFEDVIGQRGVVETLRNAIASGRLAQSFIFAGPRGVGKTTTARILARALNCEHGPTGEPCGSCDACREIAEGRDVDVLEIDGPPTPASMPCARSSSNPWPSRPCAIATRSSSSTRSTACRRTRSTRC